VEDVLVPIVSVVCIFVILPSILLRTLVQWKKMRSLSGEDENLLDDMNSTAQRLENRVRTIERILDAENPNWRKDK
jgi:phage shock protein B